MKIGSVQGIKNGLVLKTKGRSVSEVYTCDVAYIK
jgi:hypothetical protein